MRVGLLHGFLGDPAAWDACAAAAPDGPVAGAVRGALPGHGGGAVLATWDANLAAVATALGPCDVVVGYSLGARIALGLVAAGLAPRAVLISVNPGLADDALDARAQRRAADAAWAARLRTNALDQVLDAWDAQPLFTTRARAPRAALDARRARSLGHDADQLARSLEVLGLAEMPDYHAAVDHRTALIAGADDPRFVELARALPAPLELIAASGHDPLIEQPATLAGAIARALAVVG